MTVTRRSGTDGAGFVPPVYPFDRLGALAGTAAAHAGGAVDLSIGTPCDAPPPEVLRALAGSGAERGYPTSVGSAELREAAAAWMDRRLGVEVPTSAIAACVGTKELVAGVPHFLRLRDPSRDTVLHPALAYPTYEMGATLAGCRAVAVPAREDGTMDLAAVAEEVAERALCLWVNSPANPSGQLDDLAAAAAWGFERGVPVFSDECYVEFTWNSPRHSILQHGLDGLVAVHSLSKRSNLAGLRVGFVAGDPDLVSYLAAVRRHAGFMVPGPVQAAAAAALGDDDHVDAQRRIYLERLGYFGARLGEAGIPVEQPGGGFYLWARVPERFCQEGDVNAGFALARHLAETAGVLGSPGDAYGPTGAGFLRLAMVQPMERLELAARRLAEAGVG